MQTNNTLNNKYISHKTNRVVTFEGSDGHIKKTYYSRRKHFFTIMATIKKRSRGIALGVPQWLPASPRSQDITERIQLKAQTHMKNVKKYAEILWCYAQYLFLRRFTKFSIFWTPKKFWETFVDKQRKKSRTKHCTQQTSLAWLASRSVIGWASPSVIRAARWPSSQ